MVQTAVWAVVTGVNMNTACWYGYNHTDYYYIVEGPRLAVIAVRAQTGWSIWSDGWVGLNMILADSAWAVEK